MKASYIVVTLFIIAVSACDSSVWKDGQQKISNDSQDYYSLRENLKKQTAATRFSSDIHLDEAEKLANKLLLIERDRLLDIYDSIGFFPPANDFFKSKQEIGKTSLFRILRSMPKGAFLHMHASAVKDFRWVIEEAVKMSEIYVFWQPDNDRYIKGQLSAFKSENVPEGFAQISSLDKRDPNFRDELFRLLTFDHETSSDTIKIWKEFDKIFLRIGKLYSYEPFFEKWHEALFQSLLNDNIQHAELRQIMFGGLYDLDHPPGFYNEDSIIVRFQRLENKIQKENPRFSLKLIYTDLRFRTRAEIEKSFLKAFELRSKYPDLIKGFDLVANEDDGRKTIHYIDTWLMADSLKGVYGIDLPFYFHDGESNWASIDNLYDAVLLDSRRIGHGFNLNLFPNLKPLIRQKDIAIEVSPISNQALGYLEDLRVHPANTWIRENIQISISSDDPAIYRYEGLSYDYWMITLAWQLDLRDLKKLSMNGLTYSSMSDREKKIAFEYWDQSWNKFIHTIIQNYQ